MSEEARTLHVPTPTVPSLPLKVTSMFHFANVDGYFVWFPQLRDAAGQRLSASWQQSQQSSSTHCYPSSNFRSRKTRCLSAFCGDTQWNAAVHCALALCIYDRQNLAGIFGPGEATLEQVCNVLIGYNLLPLTTAGRSTMPTCCQRREKKRCQESKRSGLSPLFTSWTLLSLSFSCSQSALKY